MHRKRPFTLLETLVAFTFISAIFLFLINSFTSSIKIFYLTEEAKALTYQRFYLHQRLSLLFRHLSSLDSGDLEFYLDEQTQALHFCVDGFIDIDPKFIGPLDCILEKQGSDLVLTIINRLSNSKREEILFKNIQSIDYLFERNLLHTTEKKQVCKKIKNWKKEFQMTPLSVNLELTLKTNKSICYYFKTTKEPTIIIY